MSLQSKGVKSDLFEEEDLGQGFPPSERKIVTQAFDLSIKTLVEQWQSNILILPEIQREYVWDNRLASRLIESLLLNIPIPVLYFAETEDAKYEVIDGHQRVNSIVRFLGNEFPLKSLEVMSEYNKLRFHQLPDRERRFLEMRIIRAVIIQRESHSNMKYLIFERLNSGSVVLNSQELRNALYRGGFNRLLRDLVNIDDFRAVIGSKEPRRRMADEELVLRFFALREDFSSYMPPLKRFLNNYMMSANSFSEKKLSELSTCFTSTISLVENILGDEAFRPLDSEGKREKTINRALFDAQMLAFSWITLKDKLPRDEIGQKFGQLFASDSFMDSIQLATSDKVRTRTRVRMTVEALRDCGVELSPPKSLFDES